MDLRGLKCPLPALRTRKALSAMLKGDVLVIECTDPLAAVDTHIFRVANRTGLATGKTPFEVEQKLLQIVPEPYRRHAHHWLILHGRYVCTARRPLCEKCIIADLCKWPAKTIPA